MRLSNCILITIYGKWFDQIIGVVAMSLIGNELKNKDRSLPTHSAHILTSPDEFKIKQHLEVIKDRVAKEVHLWPSIIYDEEIIKLQTIQKLYGETVALYTKGYSLNTETNYKALRSAMSILDKLPGWIELNTVKMQQLQKQEGGYDCGLFAIACAFELCTGNNPATLKFMQKEMRIHYQQCMDNQLMTSFPHTQRGEHLV